MKKILMVKLLLLVVISKWFVGPVVAADRTHEIGVEAYIYAYPLVMMEITRRVSTNVEAVKGIHAPMNQFAHIRAYPDHNFREVVRPNADTLYSILWFDVSKEPQILSIAGTGGRYFMLPILDMWTDVIASPGSRTSGTDAANYAIVGPNWQGELPKDVELIRSTTNMGWIIGRTQTNGAADYANVHKIQNGYEVTPLSQWGKSTKVREKIPVNSSWDMKTPPPVQVANMSAETYFELFADLLKNNPPHELDWNIVKLLEQINIVPGEEFSFSALPADKQKALQQAMVDAQKLILKKKTGDFIDGWGVARELMGNYGTSYLQRAYIALIGIGANVPEDAVYPMTAVDSEGKPYKGSHSYVMHFSKEQLPPVRGFWSLSMYDHEMYFVDNPIGRYAIGDRDKLRFNDDGSLDLYIQHKSPGKDKESNWLPAPSGDFDLVLRAYWPMLGVLTGDWNPPPVKRVQ
jgi:hypothetical protein